MSRMLRKTCTYAVMHLVVAIVVAFALTGDWRIALAVGIIEPLVQTLAFAIHERLWSRGRTDEAPPDLCGHARLIPRWAPDNRRMS
jgi:uncharacterized membrane protein